MKLAILASAFVLAGSPHAPASEKLAEECTGTETVQVGTRAPKILPYTLIFSANLATNAYCYDKCGADQTYAIGDSSSDPIKLADIRHGAQERLLTFDRRTAALTDYQSFDAGIGRIVRRASAKCRTAAFREPATLAKPKS